MRDAAATAPRSNRETISARTPSSYVASVVFQHRPHHVKDPIVAAAHVVTALQAIAARETDPLSSAVVSVTMFHAGDAYNVIPQGREDRGHTTVFVDRRSAVAPGPRRRRGARHGPRS